MIAQSLEPECLGSDASPATELGCDLGPLMSSLCLHFHIRKMRISKEPLSVGSGED